MVFVISEAVSTSEKLNGKNKKIKKLNNTKQQYIEQNKAAHARLGLICVLLRHSVSKFYTSRAKIEKGKIFTYNGKLALDN